MENLKLRDDHGNHNRDQMDDDGVSQSLKPQARSNNGNILPENKLREVLKTEMLVHHNRDAEND